MCRQNSMQVNSNWDPLAILTAAECGSSLVEKRKNKTKSFRSSEETHTFQKNILFDTFVELSQSFQTSLKKNVHLESHAAIFWFKTRLESSLKFGSKSAGMNPIGPPPPRRRITGRRNERLEEEAGTRAVKAKAVAVKAATAVAKASAAAVAKGAAPNAAVIVKAKPPAPPPPVGAGAPFVVPAAVKAKPPPPPVGAKAANPALAVPVPTDQQTVVDGAATFQADGDPIVGDGPVHAQPLQGYSSEDSRIRIPAIMVPPFGTCQHLTIADYATLTNRGTINLGEVAIQASILRNGELRGVLVFMVMTFLNTSRSPGCR